MRVIFTICVVIFHRLRHCRSILSQASHNQACRADSTICIYSKDGGAKSLPEAALAFYKENNTLFYGVRTEDPDQYSVAIEIKCSLNYTWPRLVIDRVSESVSSPVIFASLYAHCVSSNKPAMLGQNFNPINHLYYVYFIFPYKYYITHPRFMIQYRHITINLQILAGKTETVHLSHKGIGIDIGQLVLTSREITCGEITIINNNTISCQCTSPIDSVQADLIVFRSHHPEAFFTFFIYDKQGETSTNIS